MNTANENQHWISRHLLKRFKVEGAPFECYQVHSGQWVPKSLDRACAAPGYTQLLVAGEVDNTLEAEFSKIESTLAETLRFLDDAANRSRVELPNAVYENLCWYCAFLSGISPYSKATGVVNFFEQLNMELKNGGSHLLQELNIPEETIRQLSSYSAHGFKVIIEAENLLQLIYRFQFGRNYQVYYSMFLATKWLVCKSPIELPMSDIGLVPMLLETAKAIHYLLPIRPNLVLDGTFFHDPSKNSVQPIVQGINLSKEQAEYRYDCICASAITELICARRLSGIDEARARAKADGTGFVTIPEPKRIQKSGLIDCGKGEFGFRIMTVEEYVQVVHSYVRPINRD